VSHPIGREKKPFALQRLPSTTGSSFSVNSPSLTALMLHPLSLPAAPTQLYLIRHGEVETQYDKVFSGSRVDMGLSEHGHQQAHALGQWLAQRQIHALHASPMKRVQQTLAPYMQQRQDLPLEVHSGLQEMDFGLWTGHRWDGIQQHFGVSAYDWLGLIERGSIPQAESATDLRQRVRPILERILQQHSGQCIAIACHGGIIRIILSLFFQQELPRMAHYNIDYGSLTQLSTVPTKAHGFELDLLNFCPPLTAQNGSAA
jgi:broad specificity phosphatase PhoE